MDGPTPSWTVGPLSGGGVFGASPRATFSPADWHLWILDAQGPPGHLAWRLRLVSPESGEVTQSVALPSFAELDDAWLVTYGDGRVLMAGNRSMGARGAPGRGSGHGQAGKPERFVLALLSSPSGASEPLALDAVYEGDGHLVAAPKVANGVVSVLLRHLPTRGDSRLEAAGVTLAAFTGGWPSLAQDLAAW